MSAVMLCSVRSLFDELLIVTTNESSKVQIIGAINYTSVVSTK